MLVCENVVKKYYSCTAVNHVNVQLDKGKVYAMLGPNGSGKTTLMKMIVGLIQPTEGKILIDGKAIDSEDKARITYMPTESYFYTYMKVNHIVNFYKDFYPDFDENRFNELMARMELSYNDKVKNMSTGMLAKLKIAVALSRKSEIIMLDEPLNGIDILAREVIINTIKDSMGNGSTLLISSHLVDELEDIVDGALFMKDGNLVMAGDADKLRADNNMSIVELYKQVYGGGNFNV